MATSEWVAWHERYDDPGSRLTQRLAVVRDRIRIALDEAPPGPLRAVSLVAGQGRDLIPVLASHGRGQDVTARLVELDPVNADAARQLASSFGLTSVDVVTGDAASMDGYADLAPADLVLLCGLFGNISDDDIRRTIAHTTSLVRRGGTVIWTRHRGEPDAVPWIVDCFESHGLASTWLSDASFGFGVGVQRATNDPTPLTPGVTLFTFVGH